MAESVLNLARWYAQKAVASYRGNLEVFATSLEKNWIPTSDDNSVDSYIAELKSYLASISQAENDDLLLRFGIIVPGIQRGIDPPMLVLTENRGGYKEKRQRESAGQVSRLREVIELGRALFADLPSDTRSLIKILQSIVNNIPAISDDERLRLFSSMSAADRQAFSNEALSLAKDSRTQLRSVGVKMLQDLACFQKFPISQSTASELVRLKIFRPGVLYRSTGDDIASRLLTELNDSTDRLDLNHILLCLAWNQSSTTKAAFKDWSRRPPNWSSKLHIAAVDYTVYGGWTLNKSGQSLDLIEESCFRIPVEPIPNVSLLRCLDRTESTCITCEGKLSNLFDFRNVGENRVRQIFSGKRLNAPMAFTSCLHCSMYDTVYQRYAPDHSATRLYPLTKCQFENCFDETKTIYRSVSASECSPFAAAEPFRLDDASLIGGIPSWLQDATFPRCLDCGELMLFFGQHDNGSVGEEGIYHAFYCPDCRISAVNYEQT